MEKKYDKYVRVCPRCGSTNIISDPLTERMGIGVVNYRCKDCNYDGPFPEINLLGIDKFRKDIRKK